MRRTHTKRPPNVPLPLRFYGPASYALAHNVTAFPSPHFPPPPPPPPSQGFRADAKWTVDGEATALEELAVRNEM